MCENIKIIAGSKWLREGESCGREASHPRMGEKRGKEDSIPGLLRSSKILVHVPLCPVLTQLWALGDSGSVVSNPLANEGGPTGVWVGG